MRNSNIRRHSGSSLFSANQSSESKLGRRRASETELTSGLALNLDLAQQPAFNGAYDNEFPVLLPLQEPFVIFEMCDEVMPAIDAGNPSPVPELPVPEMTTSSGPRSESAGYSPGSPRMFGVKPQVSQQPPVQTDADMTAGVRPGMGGE